MKEIIAVSACLLGANVKYNGKNNYDKKLKEYLKDKIIVPICPEINGGLKVPRIPSEIKSGKIINSQGEDVTKYFLDGAKRTLEELKKIGCKKAILKANSPSCGAFHIYDGNFNHTLILGEGITAKLLKENGIEIIEI